MRVCVLGSGSEGNATLIFTDDTAILIDAGFAAKTLEQRLETVGMDPARINAVLITHEHTDHIRGAEVFTRRYGIKAYMTEGTAQNAPEKLQRDGRYEPVTPEEDFAIGDMEINPFPVPHDGKQPVAYMVRSGGRCAVNITDLGYVTGRVVEKMRLANLAVVESNHDRELLAIGPYPWHLKERIAGRGGHLSNDECAELISHAGGNGLSRVVFAHLSKINNNPELVRVEAEKMFGRSAVAFSIAAQNTPGEVYEV